MRANLESEAPVACVQGAYFLLAGAWPLASLKSFEAVTGPKRERWLIRSLATAMAVAGAALLSGARSRRVTPELALLANGMGLGFGLLELTNVIRGRIRRVYLGDVALQFAFAAAWAFALRK